MFYIRVIPPDEADGPIKEIYDGDFERAGFVPNYTQALSLRPEVLTNYRTLLRSIHKNLRLRRYELVTVAAASHMRCKP